MKHIIWMALLACFGYWTNQANGVTYSVSEPAIVTSSLTVTKTISMGEVGNGTSLKYPVKYLTVYYCEGGSPNTCKMNQINSYAVLDSIMFPGTVNVGTPTVVYLKTNFSGVGDEFQFRIYDLTNGIEVVEYSSYTSVFSGKGVFSLNDPLINLSTGPAVWEWQHRRAGAASAAFLETIMLGWE